MRTIDYPQLKLLVLDVDGVLTDGGIIYTAAGEEIKAFHVKDGSGMRYWKRAGGRLAILTGRSSAIVDRRAGELGVDEVRQGCKHKQPAYEAVLATMGLSARAVAVVGDDLPDLPLLRACGFSACPADAAEEVRQNVDYVCRTAGGQGVVREVVEHILRRAGRWEDILARYLPNEEGSRE